MFERIAKGYHGTAPAPKNLSASIVVVGGHCVKVMTHQQLKWLFFRMCICQHYLHFLFLNCQHYLHLMKTVYVCTTSSFFHVREVQTNLRSFTLIFFPVLSKAGDPYQNQRIQEIFYFFYTLISRIKP